jgi:hypothetical protein
MVVHTCDKCLKEFNKKSHYIQHINKKLSCLNIDDKTTEDLQEFAKNCNNLQKIAENCKNLQNNTEKSLNLEEDNKTIDCKYCFKNFYSLYTLKRHIEKCKIKKLEDEKKENIFNNLIEKEKINDLFKMYEQIKKENEEKNKLINEINIKNDELIKKNDELNKKIDKILKKNNKSVVNNNTINNNINNNINITPFKINPFGKETFDKLCKKDILKIMTDTRNNGKHCINKLIDLIHFNNNLPENQNIYMSDFNRGKFMINDGKDWNISQNEEFILFEVLDHVRKLYFDIDDEEFEDKFENNVKFRNDFNNTFKKYYDYLYDELDDNELTEQELEKKINFKSMMNTEVKNKLYNRRKLVMDNQEKIKNMVDSTTKLLEIK